MSRTRSPRASNTIRSAIRLAPKVRTFGLWCAASVALAAGCASKVKPPVAAIAAAPAAHVGVALQLDGSASLSLRGGNPLTYAWVFTALPPRSKAALNDARLAKPSFVPDLAGTYSLLLTVDDGLLASSMAVDVTVADDCRPTIATLSQSPERPQIGQTAAVSATAGTSCGGSAIVAWQWSIHAAPAGSRALILLADTATPSFTPDVRGNYDLVVQVTDSFGLTSDTSDTKAHLTYSTQPCGDNAPVVQSIAVAPTAPDVGGQVALSAVVTDADSDLTGVCGLKRAFSYAWSLLELPAGSAARLNNVAIRAPSFTPDLHGTYVVGLLITDNLGRQSQLLKQTIATTGCGDATPTAVVPAFGPVATGTSVQLHTAVTDADNPVYNGTDSAGGPAVASPASGACNLPLNYSYRWTLVSAPIGSKAALNNAGLANPSFVADVQGSYVLSVVAAASTGHASAPTFVTVTAIPCGSVPIAAAIVQSGAVAATGTPLSLTATVTDSNDSCSNPVLVARPFSYAWSIISAPPGSRAALAGTNALGVSTAASPSLTPDVNGAYTIGLAVTDQLGLKVVAAPSVITAAFCNQAPTAAISFSIAPVTAVGGSLLTDGGPETGAPVTLTAVIGNGNTVAIGCPAATTASYSYAWSIVNQPAGSAAQLNNPSALSPSFTPDVAGTYRVQLIATDAGGNVGVPAQLDVPNVGSCTQPLTVNSINVVTPAPLGTGLPIALGATVTDPNYNGNTPGCPLINPLLTYSWSLVRQPNGSHATLNNANAANPSFVPDVATSAGQEYIVELVATDAAGLKSAPTDSSKLVVGGCSQSLASDALLAPQVIGAGQPITLSIPNLRDPNAGVLGCPVVPQNAFTYAWQIVGLPTGSKAQLNSASASAPSFVPDLTGDYFVQASVADTLGNRGSFTLPKITVAAPCNQPLTLTTPTFSASPTVSLNPSSPSPITAATTLSDVNAAPWAPATAYAVSWRVVNGGTFYTATTAGISGVGAGPTGSGAGIVDNTVRWASGGPGVACVGQTSAYSYQWAMIARPPQSVASIADPTAVTASFVADVGGSYVLQVKATDALGNSGTATVTIPVSGCNATPSVTATASAPIAEIGRNVSLNALVTADANLGCGGAPTTAPYSYAWSLLSLPANSAAVLSSPRSAQASFVPDVATGVGALNQYQYGVVVTDALGNQGAASGTVQAVSCAMAASISPLNPAPGSLNMGTQQQVSGTVAFPPACTLALQPPVAYQWSFDQLPLGSSSVFNAPNSFNPSFLLDRPSPAVWIARLTVTDLISGATATTTSTFSTSACGGSALLPGAKVVSAAGTGGNGGLALSTTASSPTSLGTFTLATPGQGSLQFNGTLNNSGTPLVDPNSACAGPLTYQWSIYALPPGSAASIKSATAAKPTFLLDVKGIYELSLVISDGLQTSVPIYMSVQGN